jgi:hypothetical protein
MTTCKTAAASRRLDEALADGFPAGDPAALTEPAGDVRDVAGCCCAGKTEGATSAPEPAPKTASCCGGS